MKKRILVFVFVFICSVIFLFYQFYKLDKTVTSLETTLSQGENEGDIEKKRLKIFDIISLLPQAEPGNPGTFIWHNTGMTPIGAIAWIESKHGNKRELDRISIIGGHSVYFVTSEQDTSYRIRATIYAVSKE